MPQGEYLQYGGQAIIEGVMMRSPRFFSVACRAPNGEIIQSTEPLEKTWIGRQKWLKLPFLRGSWALLDAMSLGVKAMRFAAKVQTSPAYQPGDAVPAVVAAPKSKGQRILMAFLPLLFGVLALAYGLSSVFNIGLPGAGALVGFKANLLTIFGAILVFFAVMAIVAAIWGRDDDPKQAERVQDAAVGSAIIVSIGFGLFLFSYLPNLIAEQLRFAGVKNGTLINYTQECVKACFFFGYIWLIGQMKEIQEVFKYHGAEHKAINTLEANQELTIENCRKQTRLHPRCGTSFAIIVLIISFIFVPLVPRYLVKGEQGNWIVDVSYRFIVELVLLPLIAGIAYELIRLAGRFRNTTFVNIMFRPGLWSQLLTTREPDEHQIEVALRALQGVIAAETGQPVQHPVTAVPAQLLK